MKVSLGAVLLGLAVVACQQGGGSSSAPASAKTEAPAAKPENSVPTKPVAISVGDDGFQPNRVEVQKGQTSTLRFTRTSADTCATEVVFPELKVEKKLPLNQPVDVEIPAGEPRTLTFQCGMGMYKSQLVIQ